MFLVMHLDKVAEQYLVTDEMKEKLNLETISLKTTIEEYICSVGSFSWNIQVCYVQANTSKSLFGQVRKK